MNKKFAFFTLALLSSSSYADYKDDVAYTKLQIALGGSIPNGSGIAVTQVEAAIGASETNIGAWMPDINATQFSNDIIVDKSSPISNGISGHSTGVGGLFYDNNAMASAISSVDIYSASNWLLDGFLKTGSSSAPSISNTRLANHSWVGVMDTNDNSVKVLKRVDWQVEQNEFIQITAMNNGSANQPLLASSYNSIAAGLSSANHAQGSLALNTFYTAGRARPDVVAPVSATSSATPIVSSAVAMLIEQAHTAAQGQTSTISNGDTLYNGERSEVVKAVIMAGADRKTHNSSTTAQISDYREDVTHQTSNGLDSRYGAGQLNVFNNYQIMATGEQDSAQDGRAENVNLMGYDYDASFGGAQGSNSTASYFFDSADASNLQIIVSLVWNIDIESTSSGNFNPSATLYDLDLFLFDVSENALVASSESEIDNTENIQYLFEFGHEYELQVSAAGNSFNWDYGIAWHVAPVPIPAAVWLFISGLLGLTGIRRLTSTNLSS